MLVIFIASTYMDLIERGINFIQQGQYDSALVYLNKGLEGAQEAADSGAIGLAYLVVGYVYDSKGEYDRALEYYQKALEIYKSNYGDNHPDVAMAYNNIGDVYESKGEYDRALEYYQKAYSIIKGTDALDRRFTFGYNYAYLLHRVGDNRGAYGVLRGEIRYGVERVRGMTYRDRRAVYERLYKLIDLMIEVLYELGEYGEIPVYAEYIKARGLGEKIGLRRALEVAGVDEGVISEIEGIYRRMEVLSGIADSVGWAREEYEELRGRVEGIIDSLSEVNERVRDIVYPTLEGIDEIRGRLGGRVLMGFWVSGDWVYEYIVSGSDVRVIRLERGLVGKWVGETDSLSEGLSEGRVTREWASKRLRIMGVEMWEEVVEPVESLIYSGGGIVVSPMGEVAIVPLGIANMDGKYLADEGLVYVPSVYIYGSEWGRSGRGLVAFGRSQYSGIGVGARWGLGDLRYAEEEVRGIAEIVGGGEVHVPAEEGGIYRSGIRGARWVHFAVHGRVRGDTAELIIGPGDGEHDGVLSEMEIYDSVRVSVADVVVLSACESGRRYGSGYEGISGFARGWLYVGARGVVVSLWRVDDEGAMAFMLRFYRYIKEGMDAREAFRRAKQDLIRSPSLRHTAAAFVFYGR